MYNPRDWIERARSRLQYVKGHKLPRDMLEFITESEVMFRDHRTINYSLSASGYYKYYATSYYINLAIDELNLLETHYLAYGVNTEFRAKQFALFRIVHDIMTTVKKHPVNWISADSPIIL